jgi:ribosomal protein S6--L-glutamate ligase
MRIVVLSRQRRLYSTYRLVEELGLLRHECIVLDPLKCVLQIESKHPKILYNGRVIKDVKAVIPRIGTFGTDYSIAVIRQFGILGVPCVNEHEAIARARNKFGCLQLLARRGIRVPDTLMSRYPRNLDKLIELVGGTPVIMKLLKGTQGTGVIFADSAASVESTLETIWSLGEDIMLQRFIRESKGRDLRVLVIDGKVVSAMRRIGREGEFRSNIHRGGVGEKVKLTREGEKAAVQATEATGLKLAGVDILESKDGPLVIEVNSSPGFQGLEAATAQNIARLIVKFAVKLGRGR